MKSHKTSKQKITVWRPNNIDEHVPASIISHSPDALQFLTLLIPETWRDLDLGNNIVHSLTPSVTPIEPYQPNKQSKLFHYE